MSVHFINILRYNSASKLTFVALRSAGRASICFLYTMSKEGKEYFFFAGVFRERIDECREFLELFYLNSSALLWI